MRRLLFAIGSLCLSSQLWAAEVTIFASDNYRPLSWMENGKPKGLVLDAFEFVQKETGIQIRYEMQPWNRVYKLAEQGQGGIIGLTYNQERAAIFDYSPVVFDSRVDIVVLKQKPLSYSQLSDLSGKRVGALIGVSFGTEVDQAIKQGQISTIRDQSHAARLRNLLAGRIDAAFYANAQTELPRVMADDPELSRAPSPFMILPTPLIKDPVHVGFRKGSIDEATRQKLYQAFEKWAKQRDKSSN
ncbi:MULTISPECIES: substrate-binding periplasmic protein [Chitinibacter]|uniref:substrate-binding periplasmic protein n=1 Tax=Chitinibacter TaxID=230666 RepID=UPI000490E27D|nr:MULTISPECIES: transporter substrate-binding domain-containing protein [Chitinibacter]